MVYLSGFRFPDRAQEANYMAFSPRARQTCYDSYYPFGLFEGRTLPELDFLEITILYGGNGSGKTTLLNVMADALRLYRRAEYNRTPFFDDYARLCEPRTMRPIPTGSMILTSDDVFDYMLDLRALNDGVDMRREQMFADYNDLRREKFQMHGMKDYDRLKQVSAARRYSQSQMARRTLPANVRTRSNGESALAVFSERIREDALYLLDEPGKQPFACAAAGAGTVFARFRAVLQLPVCHSDPLAVFAGDAGGADLRFGQRAYRNKALDGTGKRAGNVGIFPEPQR